MKEIKKKINPFIFVLAFIIVLFSSIIFLSLPVFYDYKSLENKIEKNFYSEFKLNLEILDKVSYKFLPKPHLLVKKANISLNDQGKKSTIIETKNIKIFIPIKNIYFKSNIHMDSLEIQDTNIKLKINDIKDFRNYLYNKKNKPVIIKNSKLFILDKNDNAIIISPIKKLSFLLNKTNLSKELKIKGNIFDVDYVSVWKKNHETPKITYNEINFKNPNIIFKNFFKYKNKSNFSGKITASFLREDVIIDYLVDKDKIKISSPDKNQKIKIFSNVDLKPFYIETEIKFIEKKFNFIIDKFLNILLNSKKELLGNINGKIILNFENLDNQIIKNGKINLFIKENSINLNNSTFKIEKIGTVNSKFEYYYNQGDQIFLSSNVLKITDSKEFARFFQLSFSKVKKIKTIYFDLKKNIESQEISISNIHINKRNFQKKTDKSYIIKNIQNLKSLLKKILI